MVQQNGYDVRTSCFNERAERLINSSNKNDIDIFIPSKAVLKWLDEQLGLEDENAEKTTIARANTVSDIRILHPLPQLIMQWLTSQKFNLIINADATQCKTSGECTQKVEVKVGEGRNTNKDKEPLKVLT